MRLTMLEGIDAIVFDLDGTLLDRRRSFEHFVRAQWRRFSDRLQPLDEAHYVRTAIERDRDGYAPRKELFAGILAPVDLPSTLAAELLADYRSGFPAACMLFPDAWQTLLKLRAGGWKLGLITNGSVRMQRAKLQCLGLTPAFDAVLVSDEEGICKPDPRIFLLASERLETAPERAVYVGDRPEVDVAGARRAGMKAVWRRNAGVTDAVDADAVIDELGELLDLFGGKRS